MRPIRDDAEYDIAAEVLYEVSAKAERGEKLSAGEDAYDRVLTMLLEAYDDEHYPMPCERPLADRLRALMESAELNQTQLAEVAGTTKGRMSEILNGKRELSKAQIRKLSEHFKLSADYFL